MLLKTRRSASMKKISLFLSYLLIMQVSLYANEKSLGAILQKTGKSKKLIRAADNKPKKQSNFIFNKNGNFNGIGLPETEKSKNKDKSESYNYENKSNFNFKFNKGFSNPNMGSMNMGGPGGGGGGGRR